MRTRNWIALNKWKRVGRGTMTRKGGLQTPTLSDASLRQSMFQRRSWPPKGTGASSTKSWTATCTTHTYTHTHTHTHTLLFLPYENLGRLKMGSDSCVAESNTKNVTFKTNRATCDNYIKNNINLGKATTLTGGLMEGLREKNCQIDCRVTFKFHTKTKRKNRMCNSNCRLSSEFLGLWGFHVSPHESWQPTLFRVL